jgi:uncharacterized delta-60 repeat protein
MKLIYKYLLLFALAPFLATHLFAQVGSIDNTFGVGGITTLNISSTDTGDTAEDIVIQPDGKIVVTGSVTDVGNYAYVARYNTNGTLDASFNSGGIATLSILELYGVALQPDGKIVAVGTNSTVNGDFIVARLDTNGSLDAAFGTNGITQIDFGGNPDVARDVVIQPDGKIVVVGETSPSTFNMAIARLNNNGTLDTVFGINGLVTEDFGFSAAANTVALQADGDIVIGGRMFLGNQNFAFLRLDVNGDLDNTFGGDGRVDVNVVDEDEVHDIVIQPDGKIIGVGSTNSLNASRFGVVRLNVNGGLDGSFFATGIATYIVPASTESVALSVALQLDGKIIVAGYTDLPGQTVFSVMRTLSNGSLDTAFSTDGFQTIAVGADIDEATAIAQQGDGKIVLAGISDQGATNDDIALVRLNAEPIFTVYNTNDSGIGSLRQALLNANSAGGGTTVDFDIQTATPWVITLEDNLPAITETDVIIDASTQPGWSAINLVQVNGASMSGSPTYKIGFDFQNASAGEVHGFEITGFTGVSTLNDAGIRLFGSNNCNIGTSGKGNVINACYRGISINNSDNCAIQANKIGTDISGTVAVANNAVGILIQNGSDTNLIGGTVAGAENLISGNLGDGIRITSSTTNLIINNYIGTDITGTADIANTDTGIKIFIASNNQIGGTAFGEGNTIGYNPIGVEIDPSTGTANQNRISGNSIFCGLNPGINLLGAANSSKAAPVITSANAATITGTCESGNVVDIFKDNLICGSTEQGRIYLGTATTVGTAWTFTGSFITGDIITATATNILNNTSEFSNAFTVVINESPTITNGFASYSTTEDIQVSFQLQATDIDSPTLTWTILQQPADGFVSLSNATGTLINAFYTPDLNSNGLDTLIIRVADGAGGADTTEIYLQVIPVNDAPTLDPIASPQPTISLNSGLANLSLSGIGVGGASDEASQALTLAVFSSNPGIIANPTVSYTSPQTTATISYQVLTEVAAPVSITIKVKLKDTGGILNAGVDTTVISFIVPVVPNTPTPTNLAASAVSSTSIRLTWFIGSTNGVNSYEIYRAEEADTNPFSLVATLNQAIPTAYTDTGLSTGKTYFYKVRAFLASGPSDFSNIVSAFIGNIPNQPTNLIATADGFDAVNLLWVDNATDELGFKIERASVFEGGFIEIANLTENTAAFTDANVMPNVHYNYRVRAFGREGNSGYTNDSAATTAINPAIPTPFAPDNLEAVAVSPAQINLIWDYTTDPFVIYFIERSLDGVNFVEIAQFISQDPIVTKIYFDTQGLAPGITYFYRVRASTGGGLSDYSNIASAVAECNLNDLVVIRSDNGREIICGDKSAAMTVGTKLFGANYQWLKNGSPVPNGIFETFYATETGQYSCEVTIGGICQGTSINQLLVVVLGSPNSLFIYQLDDNLVASVEDADSYQWFYEYEPIPGANGFSYRPTRPGTYFVTITVDNCNSTSELFGYNLTATERGGLSASMTTAPNPVAEFIQFKFENPLMGQYGIFLTDMQGKRIKIAEGTKEIFGLCRTLDFRQFPAGVYGLELRIGNQIGYKKVIKF